MEDYERILLVKQEVFVYKIPPRATNRGFRAADWKLDAPDWTGRLRVVTKGNECIVKLEDKMTGELFAQCPVDKYPGIAVETVLDSSRYFVLRIQDGNGRSAFIGIGFADRGDSFDLNVALSDHFKWLQKSEELEQEKPQDSQPQLDLRFKEGETIKINVNFCKKSTSRPKPKAGNLSGTPGILPPPPGGLKFPSPPSAKSNQEQQNEMASPSHSVPPATTTPPEANSSGLLLDFEFPSTAPSDNSSSSDTIHQPSGTELWGDFADSAGKNANQNQKPQSTSGASWAQF